jgi:hypothetical protein
LRSGSRGWGTPGWFSQNIENRRVVRKRVKRVSEKVCKSLKRKRGSLASFAVERKERKD